MSTPFRPWVEVLGSRTLPSATLLQPPTASQPALVRTDGVTTAGAPVPVVAPAVKGTPVKVGDWMKEINAAKEPRRTQLIQLFKDSFGVDPTNADQVKKWADAKAIYNVVKDAEGLVTGGVASGAQLSVGNFDKAPSKDKASIIQGIDKTIKMYDAAGKLITTVKEYEVEGFAVDANGVAKGTDLHLFVSKLGAVIDGKTVASVEWTVDFTAAWGIYKGKTIGLHDTFYKGVDPPPADAITPLSDELSYEAKFTLNSEGKWFFIDDSTGVRLEGTFNILVKPD
ncbi:MAG: hypothetical protein K2X82_21565 [Gemmataceae bacterium]|nr:hypothetical protein [Gemmataceae bacterium]